MMAQKAFDSRHVIDQENNSFLSNSASPKNEKKTDSFHHQEQRQSIKNSYSKQNTNLRQDLPSHFACSNNQNQLSQQSSPITPKMRSHQNEVHPATTESEIKAVELESSEKKVRQHTPRTDKSKSSGEKSSTTSYPPTIHSLSTIRINQAPTQPANFTFVKIHRDDIERKIAVSNSTSTSGAEDAPDRTAISLSDNAAHHSMGNEMPSAPINMSTEIFFGSRLNTDSNSVKDEPFDSIAVEDI